MPFGTQKTAHKTAASDTTVKLRVVALVFSMRGGWWYTLIILLYECLSFGLVGAERVLYGSPFRLPLSTVESISLLGNFSGEK